MHVVLGCTARMVEQSRPPVPSPLRQGVVDQPLGHVSSQDVPHLHEQDLGQQHAGLGKRQLGGGRDSHGLRGMAGEEGGGGGEHTTGVCIFGGKTPNTAGEGKGNMRAAAKKKNMHQKYVF